MNQDGNNLQGQGKKPLDEKDGLQETHQSGNEITAGANQDDQLAKLKDAVPEGGRDAYPERQAGAPPDTYLPPEQRQGEKSRFE